MNFKKASKVLLLSKKLNKKFVSVAKLSSALDCLYALGAIELLDEGVIQYVS